MLAASYHRIITKMGNTAKTFIDKMLYGPRLILVTGHFGSGKTEFSVSLAMLLARLMHDRDETTSGADEAETRNCRNAADSAELCRTEREDLDVNADKSQIEGNGSGILTATNQAAVELAYEAYGRYAKELPKESYMALADLDIENPYFRSRERRDLLSEYGVSSYSDAYGGKNESELQTVSAAVLAPIEDPTARLIIDTGGNDTGAMILNQFSRHFHDNYQMLQVINCNRPGTTTVDDALSQIRATEKITGLKVSGLVSNAHFVTYTTKEDVLSGYEFTREVSRQSGIPLLCVCAKPDIYRELVKAAPGCTNVTAGGAADEPPAYFPIGMYMRESYLDKVV